MMNQPSPRALIQGRCQPTVTPLLQFCRLGHDFPEGQRVFLDHLGPEVLEPRDRVQPGLHPFALRQASLALPHVLLGVHDAGRLALPIDIGVIQRPAARSDDSYDTLMDLVESIAGYLCLRKLSAFAGASWVGAESGMWDSEKLRDEGVFISVTTLKYRVIRSA